jgi:hypothetical protein
MHSQQVLIILGAQAAVRCARDELRVWLSTAHSLAKLVVEASSS